MITLQHLYKSYDTPIFQDFSYQFSTKGIICLFGPSGCGKTTLVRLMLGLETLDQGSIVGMEEKRTSVVFQEHRLLPWLTGAENVLSVNPSPKRFDEFAKELQLNEELDKYPDEMSGGMKRRIALMRALVYDGDLFFLDEPFQGIDLVQRKTLFPLLRHHLSQKTTFFITHNIEEVLALADEVLVLHGQPLQVKAHLSREMFFTHKSMVKTLLSH